MLMCAILATDLLPSSLCYRLHKIFLYKGTKIIVNIKKSATVFVYNDAINIARSVRNVSGALCK